MFESSARSSRRGRAAPLLLLAAALCAARPARSLAADAPPRLTLADALALAGRQNPALLAQAQAVASSHAAETTAGLPPNPTFQNDTTSATAGIYQEVEIGGKRRSRVESARLATAVSAAGYADARRGLVLSVQQTFIGGLLAQADIALARENIAGFRKVIEANRTRLERGALSGADFLKIELQLLPFETDLEDARLALKSSKATLKALLGVAGLPEEFELEGDLKAGTHLEESLPALERRALASRPDLKSAEAGREKAAADVRLAKANAYPDPTIGVSWLHTGNEIGGPGWFQPFFPKGETSNAMGLGVSFPIPVFNRNQGEVARTRAEQERADLLLLSARNQVLQDVEAAYAAFEWSRDRVRLYEETYLGQARESREIAEYAFERGATSIVDLLDAERTYRATELAYRKELATYLANRVALEAAVGGGAGGAEP